MPVPAGGAMRPVSGGCIRVPESRLRADALRQREADLLRDADGLRCRAAGRRAPRA